jgi:hypothetical protein
MTPPSRARKEFELRVVFPSKILCFFFALVFSYAIQSLSTYNVLHSADRFLSFPYAARLRGGWFFEP